MEFGKVLRPRRKSIDFLSPFHTQNIPKVSFTAADHQFSWILIQCHQSLYLNGKFNVFKAELVSGEGY